MKTRSQEKRHHNGATLIVLTTAATLALAGPLHADIDLAANAPIIMGPIQVRFNSTTRTSRGTPRTSRSSSFPRMCSTRFHPVCNN